MQYVVIPINHAGSFLFPVSTMPLCPYPDTITLPHCLFLKNKQFCSLLTGALIWSTVLLSTGQRILPGWWNPFWGTGLLETFRVFPLSHQCLCSLVHGWEHMKKSFLSPMRTWLPLKSIMMTWMWILLKERMRKISVALLQMPQYCPLSVVPTDLCRWSDTFLGTCSRLLTLPQPHSRMGSLFKV